MESKRYQVYDIEWDFDDVEDDLKNLGLPTEMVVDVFEDDVEDFNDEWDIESYISDYISDKIGFCHKGFNYDEM